LENREHLCLTVSFDHDIIDGAPAARFIQHFKELVESSSGLMELQKEDGFDNDGQTINGPYV
jgi:pyruvate/2-oxoglutarate dehydrogenase complex dihydrolipoamide acyltransferase (E2) component